MFEKIGEPLKRNNKGKKMCAIQFLSFVNRVKDKFYIKLRANER